MKKGKLLIVFALVSLVLSACSIADTQVAGSEQGVQKMGVPSGYNLVWSDEFNGSGQPNSANWNYHVGNGYNPNLPGFQGWGNGEWEWYRPENCYQSGGNLVIKGEYSSTPFYTVNGQNWYQRSGRITSRGKKNFQYGYIEARIKNPTLQGNWTAFWMMGASGTGDSYTASYNPASTYYDTTLNNWASCGEIDIMEHCAGSTTGNNYCFWDTRTGIYAWTYGMNGDYGTTSANYGDPTAYHTYAILWDASSITWYVDGNQTWRIDTTPATLEEFRKPFYFILNMAIGGTLAGNVSSTGWPIYMYVDYVRVYQYGGTASSSSSSTASSSSSVSSSSSSATSSSSSTSATFTYGATLSGTTTTLFFKPGWTASWVDVHYIYNNGAQQNFRMTYNSTTKQWEQKVTGTAKGKTIKYFFTYEKGGLAYDTPWYTKKL